MAWQDRIRQAAYTGPSGTRIPFIYEDVGLAVDKKTGIFNFPDADGTFVQDLGKTGRRYPLRLIIAGTDYDQTAATLLEVLTEQGVGRLEHPIYGTVDVVPTGTIRRRDDLKTAGNQAVFEVDFLETIGIIFPTDQDDPGADVEQAVEEYNVESAEQFAADADLDGAAKQAIFKQSFESTLDQAAATLRPVAETSDRIRGEFSAVYDSIVFGIDALVGDPAVLISQTNTLVQVVAGASDSIEGRLNTYGALITAAVSGFDVSTFTNFLGSERFAAAASVGQVITAVGATFKTRAEALTAAEQILNDAETLNEWREANYTSFGELDTGESYQAQQTAVALAAGFLVELSFSLAQEYEILTDRARSVIDLCAELYGEIDPRLDFFISSNNLTGDEIIEIPAGRAIRYYV